MKIKSIILSVLAIGLFSIFIFNSCETQPVVKEQSPLERGHYLVTIAGCNDCHTPKIMSPEGIPLLDSTRLLSGHPQDMPHPDWTPQDLQQRQAIALVNPMLTSWAGPWGVSFTMNLTPDKETGLGDWTEQAFIQAIRSGKHQGQPDGRGILPPMPWEMYKHMTDDDLKAVWSYLRSLPAVHNQVPTPVPPMLAEEKE